MGVVKNRWLWWPLGALGAGLGAVVVTVGTTPTPGALLTRLVFNKEGGKVLARNLRYADDSVSVEHDIDYLPVGSPLRSTVARDTRLDLYQPAARDAGARPLPLIVWIHGGGWVSGDKRDPGPFLTRLAAAGFAVASVNYSLAPEQIYPLAIRQLNAALGYLSENAQAYGIANESIVLAGDSAGGNLAAQLAAIITDTACAERMAVEPSLRPPQVRGALLYCGVYDAYALSPAHLPRGLSTSILRWAVSNTLWAYTGNRSSPSAQRDQMSTVQAVTGAYPPVWVTGGNADILTRTQSVPLVDTLTALGVDVSSLIWTDQMTDQQLGHEYQYELGTDAAQRALAESIAFVRRVTGISAG